MTAVDAAVEFIDPVYLPPQLVAEHGAYVVLWHTEALRFDFDRVRSERRSGEVSAEVAVTRLLKPSEPLRIGRLPNTADLIQSGSASTSPACRRDRRWPGRSKAQNLAATGQV